MLVTAICPTADRHSYLPLALRCFQRQTYADKELIIVDNGLESVEPLLETLLGKEANGPELHYYRLDPKQYGKLTHGQMMNECCERARGEIICAWDDDDWSHPDRIALQVAALNENGKSLTGYHEILYYEIATGSTFKYKYNGHGDYACGSSQMFTRDLWNECKFPNKAVGADNDLSTYARQHNQLVSTTGIDKLVARTHESNTSTPRLGTQWFPPVSPSIFPKQFFEDLNAVDAWTNLR